MLEKRLDIDNGLLTKLESDDVITRTQRGAVQVSRVTVGKF